jgi:hypothetical protein
MSTQREELIRISKECLNSFESLLSFSRSFSSVDKATIAPSSQNSFQRQRGWLNEADNFLWLRGKPKSSDWS